MGSRPGFSRQWSEQGLNTARPTAGQQRSLIRAARLLTTVVAVVAALDWAGWATGFHVLTRLYPTWPPMTPWTALWLAALGAALVLQARSPSPSRVRAGRAVAAVVGVVAVVVLAEYATARSFGLDQMWFGDAVRTVQSSWPGRPSPLTAASVLFLSAAVLPLRVSGRATRITWGVLLAAAMAPPALTALAYPFDVIAMVSVATSTGMAATTALCLLLLGTATTLVRPGANLGAWWLSQTNRWWILGIFAIVAASPLQLAAVWRLFTALGFGVDERLALSAALGTTLIGGSIVYLVYREQNQRSIRDTERVQLQATADAILTPQVLLEALRNSSGQVVDFLYREVNKAACDYLGVSRGELLGRRILELMPGLAVRLFPEYLRCLETGEPVVLDDFTYDNEIIAETRRYDIRVTRATATSLVLAWSDVTDRFHAAQRVAESERYYRLLAENIGDVVSIHRDGKFEWLSPSVEAVLGAPPAYWIGREVREIIPPGYEAGHADRMRRLAANGIIQERSRVKTIDGRLLWVQLTLKTLAGEDGHHGGYSASFRVIDDEVAAEQRAEESRRQQARADALYRRSVDSSAVGMCLADLEGNFVETNQALCEFFGYDAPTLRQMTWQQLTDPEYLEADLDNRARVLAGDIESYRMVKRFIHADGHPIWGDLSVSCIRDASGQVEMFIGQITDISAEVKSREELEQARREKEREEERYRRSIDNAAVGMCMVTLDGRLYDINEAGCRFFGHDAQELNGTHWQDVTAPEFLEEEQRSWDGILEGRIDSYRMVKHYQHADGHRIWGDLSVSGIRDDTGRLEHMVALVTDVTAQVEADERNRLLAQQLELESNQLKGELDSAAAYMSSIMPHGLEGRVHVTSRYLPSRQLGGDCLDYYWLDDDHLLIKLIDVSGHGLEPALLAVSVHNLMRSGTLDLKTLLSPEAVLAELNRLFAMDEQNDHYFTMWYGIYEASSRTLRYANAGSPPALAFNSGVGTTVESTALSTTSAPIGMFEDTDFASRTYHVPHGCRILIHSDGANEIGLNEGRQGTLADFHKLTDRVAASPDWSLDDLINELRALTPSHDFEDDCSLIQLAFD